MTRAIEWVVAGRTSKVHAIEDQGSRSAVYYQGKSTLCGATVPDYADADGKVMIIIIWPDSVDCRTCRKAIRNTPRSQR